jgi:Flp pilus assembly protein TadD
MGEELGSLDAAVRYYEAQQFQSALNALAHAGDDALEQPRYWLVRAESLRRLGRDVEAGETARAGLERWPEDIGLLDSLGLSLLAADDLANAEAVVRAALRLSPERPSLIGHHALVLARLDRFDEARTAAEALMTITPDSTFALGVRATVAFLAQDPAAESYVAELLARDPESLIGHQLRGAIAVRRRDAKPAARAYAEAAALSPTDTSIAKTARALRLAAHPLLFPSRRILMLGRRRAQLLYFAVLLVLFALRQGTLVYIWFVFWLVFMVVVPRVLRAHYRSKYGQL